MNELFKQHHPGGIVRKREINFAFKKGFSFLHVALVRLVGETNEDHPVVFFEVLGLFEGLQRLFQSSGSSPSPLGFLEREDQVDVIHEDDGWLELFGDCEGHVKVFKSAALVHAVAF